MLGVSALRCSLLWNSALTLSAPPLLHVLWMLAIAAMEMPSASAMC